MRAYVIGLGSIAQRHIRNIREIDPDCALIVDRPKDGRPVPEIVASAEHVVVEGIDEALTHFPDYVVVCSATAAHIDSIPKAIGARIPMYVEKPVVRTRAELDVVKDAIDGSGYSAPSMVGCNLRFLPSLQRLREYVQDGRLGRVARAHFEAGQWLPDWRPARDYRSTYSASSASGGGVVLDLIHELDAATWVLGRFDRVQSDLGNRSSLDLRAEDTAGILLSRAGGPLVTIAIDYVARTPIRRYEVVGDGGTATWSLPDRSLRVRTAGGEDTILDDPDAFDVGATYMTAMNEFMDCVRSGAQTSQPLEEGLVSLDLALTAKENSAR